jgi:hypothetical protein
MRDCVCVSAHLTWEEEEEEETWELQGPRDLPRGRMSP